MIVAEILLNENKKIKVLKNLWFSKYLIKNYSAQLFFLFSFLS